MANIFWHGCEKKSVWMIIRLKDKAWKVLCYHVQDNGVTHHIHTNTETVQAYEAEKLNRSLCFCRLPSNYDKTTSTQTLFSVFSHVVKVSGVASHLPAHWQLVIHVYFSFQAAPPVALPQKKCCCDEENALASVTALELKLFAPTQPPKSFFGHLSTRTTVTWSCLSAVCASCWRSCRLQRRIYLNG